MTRNDIFARAAAVTGAAVLSIALSACGGAANPSTAGSAPATTAASQAGQQFNDADVQFAQLMIPHHRQAVEMAELASDRAQSPEITTLADEIKVAQDPEIATLTGFLQTWGAEVPPTDDLGGMSGMDHGSDGRSGMSGMMTPQQMTDLSGTSGAAFDRMFLQMMSSHHESAVTDAQREQGEGVNPEAKALASQIISAQTEEIGRMQQLLQSV